MPGEKIDLAAGSSTLPFLCGLRLGMDVSKEDMPHMQRRGVEAAVDFVPVHFFAFFLAVWGEFNPPASFAAAVTSKPHVRHSRVLPCAG